MSIKNRIITSLAATVIMPVIFYYFSQINNTFLDAGLSGKYRDIILMLIAGYALAWLTALLFFVSSIACELDKRISNTNT